MEKTSLWCYIYLICKLKCNCFKVYVSYTVYRYRQVWEQNCTKSAKVPPSILLQGLECKNLPCIHYTAAGFLPNKRNISFQQQCHSLDKQNSNDISRVQRLTYKASDTVISCKMVFNLLFHFLLFFPSEMTGLEMASHPHPPVALLYVG